MKFLHGTNEEAIHTLAESGFDVSVEQDFDFRHYFIEEADAKEMAAEAAAMNYVSNVVYHSDLRVWHVYTTVRILPSADILDSIQHELDDTAYQYEGYADGWGIREA